MPVVTVNWWKGVSEEGRRQLVYDVTNSISRIAQCPKEAVTVLVQDIERSHWGRGGSLASDIT